MLIDLEKFAQDMMLDAEVCIVGAGAAGVALARDLMHAGRDICLLEGGGMDYEDATQSLFDGKNIGMEYYDLDHARLRFFGGTTNIWGGRNIPLDPIDFEKRDWVPHSGWPITFDDLQAYYRIAHNSLELGEFDYEAGNWQKLGLQPIGFDPQEITTRFWRFDDLAERFNSRRSDDLIKSENVRIVLHANTVGLQAAENAASVTRLDATTLQGRKLQVTARHFVLACGAIENARLLLASNTVEASGIGNQHDQLGRYFMEHPHGRVAHIETEDPAAFWALYRKRYPATDVPVAPALVLPPSLQKRLGILNSAATFKLQKDPARGATVSKRVYLNLKHSLSPSRSGRRLWHAWRGTQDWLQRHVSMPLLRFGTRVNRMGLYVIARAEQAPNPHSRVCLSSEMDALGYPRADLDWQLCDLDKETMLQFGKTLEREFDRLGLGKVTTYQWLEDGTPEWPVDASVGNHPIGGYHHMGTTRMSNSPKTGVVDANCTVHGYQNLHIAGSSVFTTGGWANPTLTLLALTHRLGDHLNSLLTR
ncbi:MAG: GMC family oxidoreductase [Gammaproteobacteria bacterium]|nr:MAG: GMC family oxidoreductase [Gammaproteobacteria bacterium]